jgi:hypothetical protein
LLFFGVAIVPQAPPRHRLRLQFTTSKRKSFQNRTGGKVIKTHSLRGGCEDGNDPQSRCDHAILAPGYTKVDFERRLNLDHMPTCHLARAKAALERSPGGSLLLFDVNNNCCVGSTKIGEWGTRQAVRFALLTRGAGPIVRDFPAEQLPITNSY